MKFKYFNPNPAAETFKSGKPKKWTRNDNVIRAVCKVSNKEWHNVYNDLFKISLKHCNVIDAKEVINDYLVNHLNMTFQTCGKPKQGDKRYTVQTFVDKFNIGTYILYLRNYYVAVINGVVYNTTDDIKNAAVYSFWSLEKNNKK